MVDVLGSHRLRRGEGPFGASVRRSLPLGITPTIEKKICRSYSARRVEILKQLEKKPISAVVTTATTLHEQPSMVDSDFAAVQDKSFDIMYPQVYHTDVG